MRCIDCMKIHFPRHCGTHITPHIFIQTHFDKHCKLDWYNNKPLLFIAYASHYIRTHTLDTHSHIYLFLLIAHTHTRQVDVKPGHREICFVDYRDAYPPLLWSLPIYTYLGKRLTSSRELNRERERRSERDCGVTVSILQVSLIQNQSLECIFEVSNEEWWVGGWKVGGNRLSAQHEVNATGLSVERVCVCVIGMWRL